MEEVEKKLKKWSLKLNPEQKTATSPSLSSPLTVKSVLTMLMQNIDKTDERPIIPLSVGDPSPFPSFRTAPVAEDAIIDAVKSAKFNSYAPSFGILPARRAIAEYLSRDLPYRLSADDVYVTLGCKQAIDIMLSSLAHPGVNILLPRPTYPYYNARAAHYNIEVRYYDLLPERGWEVDLDNVEALANENTIAIVIINPGNPCGSVFSHQHLEKVADTARKLGILVIADEVYGHLAFGANPFVQMGVFGSIVPVVTLGALSKRLLVPGWRIGWLVINDPSGILTKSEIISSIKSIATVSPDPPTFIQGAIPQILEKTGEDFFLKILNTLREAADLCSDKIKGISCITCPQKPEGSMFMMLKLNVSLLEGITDDMDFCFKLAREESVLVLPGIAVGLKNWIRITFAVEPSSLEDGLERINSFCQRHAKDQ